MQAEPVMGTGVMDEDRDRDGDDYGDEDVRSWRELGCWTGETMLRAGLGESWWDRGAGPGMVDGGPAGI